MRATGKINYSEEYNVTRNEIQLLGRFLGGDVLSPEDFYVLEKADLVLNPEFDEASLTPKSLEILKHIRKLS